MHVKEAILMHMERESSIMKSVTREWLDSMTLVWYIVPNELMKKHFTNYTVVKQFK